jgi:hypothetical protein
MVTESLATQFLHSDVEVDCSACGYPIWVTWAEIVVQAVVRCPCCRIKNQLRDNEGSIQNAGRIAEQAINQALKGLFG